MEIIKILGVDPSLRNTGLAVVTFNTELSVHDPSAYKVSHCQVLKNPAKYTGTDALLNMIDMIHAQAQKECYSSVDNVLVESPVAMFNPKFPVSNIISCAHISGAALALFGVEKAYLFRPNEWNKSRKKEVTQAATIGFHGEPEEKWHFEKPTGHEKYMEHVIDAASLATWWIKQNYDQEA